MRRRQLLSLVFAGAAVPLLGTARAAQRRLDRTPACGDDGPTPGTTEGPFFRAGAPDRHALVAPGAPGTRITITGIVLDTACRPVPGALVQVWHADVAGDYSGADNRFRGAHRTDAQGRWWFSTIVPALYEGRARHYHFKVRKPGGAVLTTQLFFPGDARNARDSAFDERLLMQIAETADGRVGHYDFVV